jgi:hypothetical protein
MKTLKYKIKNLSLMKKKNRISKNQVTVTLLLQMFEITFILSKAYSTPSGANEFLQMQGPGWISGQVAKCRGLSGTG